MGIGMLSEHCNIAGYLDRLILAQRAGAASHDPEGLLSTVPAVVTTILGMLDFRDARR